MPLKVLLVVVCMVLGLLKGLAGGRERRLLVLMLRLVMLSLVVN
jgi:hypothetical protein